VEARDHTDASLIHDIEKPIGEAAEQRASDTGVDECMALWGALDGSKACLECPEKFATQSLVLLLVPPDCVRDVGLRGFANLQRAFHRDLRRRALT
jgi:hypothetical protein